jgi:hypothetical protein
MSVESETGSTLDQTVQLGTTEILGKTRELLDINIASHDAIGAHLICMNVQDLDSALFIR